MEKKYEDSGALFFNDPKRKVNPKQPDYSGGLDISAGLLQHLVNEHRAGKPLKLDLSGWRKDGRKGPFLSLSVRAAWEPGQSKTQPAPQKPSGGFEPDTEDEVPF